MLTAIINAFLFVKNNFKLVLGTAAFLAVSFFVFRYTLLQEKLRTTEAKLAQAQTQLAETQRQLEQMRKDVRDISKAHNDLTKIVEEAQKKNDDLRAQLERRGKKSITELAKKKRTLVQKALNNGTDKALKCLEVVSSGGDC